MTEKLDTDYLILGAGAASMAFADVILQEDASARIVLVDKRAAPGGHWNDAYSFVTLHQPAIFYGLNSTPLGSDATDLVSAPEIVTYFQQAMRRFLATGRVRFLSMCEHLGDGRVVSIVDPGVDYEVVAHRRVIDGTYMESRIPALHPPSYAVEDGVELIPPNGLTRIRQPYEEYVIVGAGKTAIDVVLFLMDNGVSAQRITWITPNDSWLWERSTVQAGVGMRTVRTMVDTIIDTPDTDSVFLDLERKGIVSRIDPTRMPTKWRCATVDRAELAKLRLVEKVVRLGRVQKVHTRRIELDSGVVEISARSLVVDCTANGLTGRPPTPIYGTDSVRLQPIFMCQQTFSAAALARIELLQMDDTRRNRLVAPVPHPESKDDLGLALPLSIRNILRVNAVLPTWLRGSRLFVGHHETLRTYLSESTRLALKMRHRTPALRAGYRA